MTKRTRTDELKMIESAVREGRVKDGGSVDGVRKYDTFDRQVLRKAMYVPTSDVRVIEPDHGADEFVASLPDRVEAKALMADYFKQGDAVYAEDIAHLSRSEREKLSKTTVIMSRSTGNRVNTPRTKRSK